MGYKKHETGIWKPESEGDFIEGVLLAVGPSKIYEKNKNYLIRKLDNSTWLVYGTTVLNDEMLGVESGQRIKIVYKGAKPATKKGFKDLELYEVQVWEDD